MLGRPRLAAKPSTANSTIIRPSEQILQSRLRARGPECPYKQQDTVERGRDMATVYGMSQGWEDPDPVTRGHGSIWAILG